MFANHISNKELLSKICKGLKLVARKQIPYQKKVKDLIGISQKITYK
jgi:regulatory protein YycI of two-component signal transduction system YycFG